MTAETLKPFITPSSAVDNFPAMQSGGSLSHRKIKLIAIGLSVAALSLAVILLGLSIWQTTRVKHLETELNNLKRVVDNLQQRLGINYLDDLDDFEREYKKALIDDPNKLDESDLIEDDQDDIVSWNGEDDEDDDFDSNGEYIDYADLIKKITERDGYNDTISEDGNSKTAIDKNADADDDTDADADLDIDGDGGNASNDDNVFDDFKSYSDSKKKRERKSRSIAEARNEVQTFDIAQQSTQNKTQLEQQQQKSGRDDSDHASHFARRKTLSTHSRHIVADHMEPRRPATPLRQRTARRRKLPVLRSGESLISAKSSALYAAPATSTAAAHFHLNRKLPHHISPIRPDGYHGDMYIGHATASNDNSWQQHFTVENGVLTVHEPGLYYIYAQICYNNTHDQNGFIIFHGHTPFLQCLNTVPTNMPQKVHTCHTSGLIQLQEQESIHLRDIHSDRNVMLRDANNRSYFGLIKV